MKAYIYLAIMIAMLTIVNAVEYYEVDELINMQFTCTINGAIPSSDATFNISLYDERGRIAVDDEATTSKGYGRFNYSYTFPKAGKWHVQESCWDGNSSYSNYEEIEIYGVGNTISKGITETSIFLLIAIIICLFIYWKVNKIFGGMGIFASGFGVLFTVTANGWIGWIIAGAGFIMLINALMTPPKRRFR